MSSDEASSRDCSEVKKNFDNKTINLVQVRILYSETVSHFISRLRIAVLIISGSIIIITIHVILYTVLMHSTCTQLREMETE